MFSSGYISNALEFKVLKNKVGPQSLYLLGILASKGTLTAYSISQFEDKPHEAYKNVNKKVKRLLSLGLISKVKEDGTWLHNAIPCTLTEHGLYYILLNYYRFNYLILYSSPGSFFEKNSSKKLLTTFVYPYIKLETIKQLQNIHFFFELFNYLHKCCIMIHQALFRLRHVYANNTDSELSTENELINYRSTSLIRSWVVNFISSQSIDMLNEHERTMLSRDECFMKLAEIGYSEYRNSLERLKNSRHV